MGIVIAPLSYNLYSCTAASALPALSCTAVAVPDRQSGTAAAAKTLTSSSSSSSSSSSVVCFGPLLLPNQFSRHF